MKTILALSLLCLVTTLYADNTISNIAIRISEPLSAEEVAEIRELEDWPKVKVAALCQNEGVPESLEQLPEVQYLEMYSLRDELPFLEKFSALRTVVVHHGRTFNFAVLKNCKDLESLAIEAFEELTELETLGQFKKLQVLELRTRDLDSIDFLQELPQLRKLHLMAYYRGESASIDSLSGLNNLEELSLKVSGYYKDILNKIAAMGQLQKLSLDFERNRHVEDLDFAAGLTQLTELEVKFASSLTDIDALAKLEQLEKLTLQSTKIASVEALKSCTQLTDLTITSCPLMDITPLAACTAIEQLDVSSTLVSDFTALEEMPKLNKLDVSDTWIEFMDALPTSESLTLLILSENSIKSLAGIGEKFPSLEALDIRDTRILDMKPLLGLEKLTRLSVSNYVPDAERVALQGEKPDLHIGEYGLIIAPGIPGGESRIIRRRIVRPVN